MEHIGRFELCMGALQVKLYIMNKQKETTMKTIFSRMAMIALLCGVLGVFVACDEDPYVHYGISDATIYAPNTVVAVEGIEVYTHTDNNNNTTRYAFTFYDTLQIEQCSCKYGQFSISRNSKKNMRVLQSIPDYQYLKITRLEGTSPIYFAPDKYVVVNGVEVCLNRDNVEELCGHSVEEIMQALVKAGRGVVWDDNEQHKVSRLSEDWPSLYQETYRETSVTIP